MLRTVLTALLPSLSLATFVVPLPNGPYGVSIQETLITDHDQPDPFLNLTYRRVPVSIISPTGSSADCVPVMQPYMPALTGEYWEQQFMQDYGLPLNDTLSQTNLILCEPRPLNQTTPVVLFAPGAGVSRYLYNILGSAIVAQTGYTVITYEAPGLTGIVQFPDGSVQYAVNNSISTTLTNEHAIAVVVQDGLVVLNAVWGTGGSVSEGTANVSSAPALPANVVNVSQAAMIGHSQGGAAALVGLLVDSRFSSGANMDGGLNATADNVAVCSNSNTTLDCDSATTQRPFTILAHQGNNQSTADGWTPVWADVLQGSKFQVELNGSQHATYGDYPYIMDLYGIRERAGAKASLVNYAVGSIPGGEVMEILSTYFASFLGYGFSNSSQTNNVTATVEELEGFGLELVNQTIVE